MSNIAFFVYDVTLTGGAERVAVNLATEFSGTDRVCLISVAMSGELPDGIADSVECLSLAEQMGSITKNFLKYRRNLRRILRERHIDYLFSITAGVVTLAVSAARRTGARVIYCEHSTLENQTYGKKHIFRQHYGADHADAVVALTRRDRLNFKRMFRTPADRLFAIPNWYTPMDSPAVYDRDSHRIISVGRLERVKGYEFIIACAERILKANPDWEWDIYGDGSLREELQSQIDERGIERLTLKGNVTDIRERYAGYSFLVMTSYYEGLSLVMLEAQTAGLPIVSFDCPTAPAEIVSNRVNGILVPMSDIGRLTESVQSLIDSEELRVSFSGHAGDGLCRFEKENVMKKWRQLLERLRKQDESEL